VALAEAIGDGEDAPASPILRDRQQIVDTVMRNMPALAGRP
jgi:hypothetical protein